MQELEKKVIKLETEIVMRKEANEEYRKQMFDDIKSIQADIKLMPEYWQNALTAHSTALKEDIRGIKNELLNIKNDYVCSKELTNEYYDKKEIDLKLQPVESYINNQRKFIWLLITSIVGSFGTIVSVLYYILNKK